MENSEQGVNCASLVSPLADARPGQRSACQIGRGSNEPHAAADSGGKDDVSKPNDGTITGGKVAGWKGGAPALPHEQKRTHTVSTRFNKAELHELDRLSISVGLRRGEYLRLAAFQALPPTIPELNKSAWFELSKAASNLNQIAHQLNKKGVEVDVDIEEISNMLSFFRQILIEVGEGYESES
ncbi:plasmid mobilization relaxosome protein MobC [Vreelandella rituensis]|uniref:Plasmid mobilization relaxosome protein MobC n=1 Tax=Vreelandella rituensis TaxID=2282306 RepID=A0A368TMU1_9GAMM|nr:plasmid mobilization relaxosome protein MobC [Halomonas rituensis]RCV86039.1 plasmid mobilization relaxosome protein MobC [Halomonas rituensis]